VYEFSSSTYHSPGEGEDENTSKYRDRPLILLYKKCSHPHYMSYLNTILFQKSESETYHYQSFNTQMENNPRKE